MVAGRSLIVLAALLTCSASAFGQQGAFQPRLPRSAGKHCLDEQRRKLLLNHTLVGSINPLGLENQLRLSLCTPLIQRPGILFQFTSLEVGLANYISPTHIHLGPFVNLTPLSVLVLRAEVTGLFIWPIPLPGAGYIPLVDYTPFTAETLEPPLTGPDAGRRAYGVRALLGGTLQGAVPLGKGLSIVAVSAFAAEYWRVRPVDPFSGPERTHYYLARRDVTAFSDGDWILANTAVLLLTIPLRDNYVVRIGATDDLVAVPAQGYVGNLVAGLAAVMVKRVSTLARNLQLFIRAGSYTHHGYRTGLALAAGLDVYYELLSR